LSIIWVAIARISSITNYTLCHREKSRNALTISDVDNGRTE
jgi:hypothetical protein